MLFGIYTLGQAFSTVVGAGGAGQIYYIAVWLIGLVAIFFLWQRPSTEYFRDARRLF